MAELTDKGIQRIGQETDEAFLREALSQSILPGAAEKAGLRNVGYRASITVSERGESGRAVTLLLNGQSVSAPEMRLALGSTQMRSTLLTSLKMENGQVKMAGKGYGHGVGMPQWGAYALAEEGKTAQEIVTYYFRDVTVEKLW